MDEGEPAAAQDQARRLYKRLEAPKRYISLSACDGAEAHCGVGNVPHASAVVYDWLEEVFDG